jgi:hypothetical protein
MVNARLTDRVALLRFDETLQQSLSGKSRGQKLLPPWGFCDIVTSCFNSLRPKGMAIVFFAGQVLETITQNSARMIMTGQAQAAAYTATQFKTYVCGQIPALFTCDKVYVDVQSYPAFTSVTINSQIDASNNFVNNMQYSPGAAGDIVVVRLFYQWPLFVTGLGYNIANLAGSQRLLTASAAFRNEPF